MKCLRNLPISIGLGMLFLAGTAYAVPELFWLSSVPPKKISSLASSIQAGSDTALSITESDSAYSATKRLWFCQGDQVGQASYLESAQSVSLEKLNALGQRFPVRAMEIGGVAQVKEEFAEKGFNNLYARREQMSGQTRWIQLAKAEMLKGSFRENNVAPEQLKAIRDPAQPLEIVREHPAKEILYTRLVSGDTVDLTVLSHGQPIAGIPVVMLTQQGWQKKVLSDDQGKVSFTLIRDYFPAWSDFLKRTRETFVIVADHEVQEKGRHAGDSYTSIHYQSTLSGRYALSPRDYNSYAYGLGIAIFVTAFGGLAIYLYRRRRIKPFKEIRFKERV